MKKDRGEDDVDRQMDHMTKVVLCEGGKALATYMAIFAVCYLVVRLLRYYFR